VEIFPDPCSSTQRLQDHGKKFISLAQHNRVSIAWLVNPKFTDRSIDMKFPAKLVECVVVIAVGSTAVSAAQAEISCHKINAKGVGQDLGGGITRAQIIGGGLLHGTTQARFTITGGAPPAVSVSGTITFTTKKALLTVTVDGIFDVVGGKFMTAGPVTAATGRLSGATGMLAFEGAQDLATGVFTEDVSGLICVDVVHAQS
jgi:hypothetical protein